MSCIAFIEERIVATKANIVAIEEAILELATDGVQSFLLNTGQNEERVSKIDLPRLNQELDRLYSRLCKMQERVDEATNKIGSGNVVQVCPSW